MHYAQGCTCPAEATLHTCCPSFEMAGCRALLLRPHTQLTVVPKTRTMQQANTLNKEVEEERSRLGPMLSVIRLQTLHNMVCNLWTPPWHRIASCLQAAKVVWRKPGHNAFVLTVLPIITFEMGGEAPPSPNLGGFCLGLLQT
jgi:hypothetical protein